MGTQPATDAARLLAPLFAEVALRAAVVEPQSLRVAGAGGERVAQRQHDTAATQQVAQGVIGADGGREQGQVTALTRVRRGGRVRGKAACSTGFMRAAQCARALRTGCRPLATTGSTNTTNGTHAHR